MLTNVNKYQKLTNINKESCKSQFPIIFLRESITSDWPSSKHNNSSHPSMGWLANQRRLFPLGKWRETDSYSSFNKERCKSQSAIFLRETMASDWPSSQHNNSSHPSVGCLANQRRLFPSGKWRETDPYISLLINVNN